MSLTKQALTDFIVKTATSGIVTPAEAIDAVTIALANICALAVKEDSANRDSLREIVITNFEEIFTKARSTLDILGV